MEIPHNKPIDLQKENERLQYIAVQKRRYPCFKCKYLISSCVFTKLEANRPSLTCAKSDINSVPDECGYFEEGKYNVCEKFPKKTKPWGV